MDNPNNLMDRMVDHLLAHEEIPFLDLVQQVWRRGWKLDEIPDPKDTDALRYALKACLLERMAEIWSSAPKNVRSAAPSWCERVAPAPVPFSVVSSEYEELWKGAESSPIFAKRNIFAPRQFMFFV
jgi:hypothetical protein